MVTIEILWQKENAITSGVLSTSVNQLKGIFYHISMVKRSVASPQGYKSSLYSCYLCLKNAHAYYCLPLKCCLSSYPGPPDIYPNSPQMAPPTLHQQIRKNVMIYTLHQLEDPKTVIGAIHVSWSTNKRKSQFLLIWTLPGTYSGWNPGGGGPSNWSWPPVQLFLKYFLWRRTS